MAEFSYDALKISEVKALGVYTCREPTDSDIVRYMFSLDVKSILLMDDQLEIKDVNVGVSAKGALVGGEKDEPRGYFWTLTLTGSVEHAFYDELKVGLGG